VCGCSRGSRRPIDAASHGRSKITGFTSHCALACIIIARTTKTGPVDIYGFIYYSICHRKWIVKTRRWLPLLERLILFPAWKIVARNRVKWPIKIGVALRNCVSSASCAAPADDRTLFIWLIVSANWLAVFASKWEMTLDVACALQIISIWFKKYM